MTHLEGYTELVDRIQGDILCLYSPTEDTTKIARLDDFNLQSILIVKGRVKMFAVQQNRLILDNQVYTIDDCNNQVSLSYALPEVYGRKQINNKNCTQPIYIPQMEDEELISYNEAASILALSDDYLVIGCLYWARIKVYKLENGRYEQKYRTCLHKQTQTTKMHDVRCMLKKRNETFGFYALVKDWEIRRFTLPEFGSQPHCKSFLKGDLVYRTLQQVILDFCQLDDLHLGVLLDTHVKIVNNFTEEVIAKVKLSFCLKNLHLIAEFDLTSAPMAIVQKEGRVELLDISGSGAQSRFSVGAADGVSIIKLLGSQANSNGETIIYGVNERCEVMQIIIGLR